MDTLWFCDTCGGKINSPADGLVEWFTFNDADGALKHGNFRLVHEVSASPLKKMMLKRKGCQFDLHEERYQARGIIENQPLEAFIGPDGLMRLLFLIAEGNFPVAEVLRMIKRLHIPGFEAAKDYFAAAASEGIVRQGAADVYHDQGEINSVLQWLNARRCR